MQNPNNSENYNVMPPNIEELSRQMQNNLVRESMSEFNRLQKLKNAKYNAETNAIIAKTRAAKIRLNTARRTARRNAIRKARLASKTAKNKHKASKNKHNAANINIQTYNSNNNRRK